VLSKKWLLLSCFVLFALFALLAAVLVPSFLSLGDLFAYAELTQYMGVSLLVIFQAELLVTVLVWLVLIVYLKANKAGGTDAYVRRHFVFIAFIAGQIVVACIAGGFLAHQDASWYQLVRNTDEVMPAQAIILLVCYPLYLFFGVGAFIYVKKRLPEFLRNKEVAFMVLTFAPFAFLPYYDAEMLGNNVDAMELAYLAAYWILSVAWVVLGVGYLMASSAKDIFKTLSKSHGNM